MSLKEEDNLMVSHNSSSSELVRTGVDSTTKAKFNSEFLELI